MKGRQLGDELYSRREKGSGSGDGIQRKTRSIAVIGNLDIVAILPGGANLNIKNRASQCLG